MAGLPVACPYCGKVNDTHDAGDPGARPTTGDVSMCFSCAPPSLFVVDDEQVRLRRATSAELADLLAHPAICSAYAAIAESSSAEQAVQLLRGERP
jgi:hypothetical protein